MAANGLFRRYSGRIASLAALLIGALSLSLQTSLGFAQGVDGPVATSPGAVAGSPDTSGLSYADLATFVEPAETVLRVRVLKQAEVPPERSPGLRPGWVRLYIEAEPEALLAGKASIPPELRYLADVPRGAKGRPPRIKGTSVILFARQVAGRPGDLQLVGTGAQLAADAVLEARLRPILAEFFSADAPPRITAIRDVLWVPGNLVGESETQLFMTTTSEVPALISVIRRPGIEPTWGVSWSELIDQAVRPPTRNTLVWYRLACFLPPRLPTLAQLSTDPLARDRAEQDYQLVRRDLGSCSRSIR